MCGISGFINRNYNSTTATLISMNDAIRHRGPDDEGYLCLSPDRKFKSYSGIHSSAVIKNCLPPVPSALPCQTGMAFSRLSILDLSEQGHQPMVNERENMAITFNGEIYNYRELRRQLTDQGFRFKSRTDTEVILKGYECWGKDIVHKLNGMFAFCLLDTDKGILWLVRDRLGIKPLFYHLSESDVTWASEIKSVLKAPWVRTQLNWEGLTANYYLNKTPPPATCFKNIYSLQPASWLEIRLDTFQIKEHAYWKIPLGFTGKPTSLQEAAGELEERLKGIVQLQSLADVPVISLMSGGIDSTTVTALLSKFHPSFECYSMGFDGTGKNNDEIPQAIAMAEKLGITHKIHLVKAGDVFEEIEKDIAHFEEPYSGPEPFIAAAKYLHTQGFKVLINGNGADEVFGGYSYYKRISRWQQWQRWSSMQSIIPLKGKFLKKVSNYLKADSVGKYFAYTRNSMHISDLEDLFLPEHQKNVSSLNQWPGGEGHFRNLKEELFYYDLKYSVSAHHVFRDDLSAMRYGLEMRYPYLDHTLIEWVSTLPFSVRYDDKITKPLLRKTAAKYITGNNLSMSKKGFSFPLHQWIHEVPAIGDYARAQTEHLKKRGMFNHKTIDRWWNSPGYSLKIWQLVTTEIWLKKYFG